MQCLYNWLCFLCLHMSVCLCSCVCVSVLNLYNKTSKRCHVKVQNLNLENPHFLSVCFLFVRIDLLHAQRFRQFTQVFSNCKLTVQSKLGPQRWAQPGYWNVHRLCVSLTTFKTRPIYKNHNARVLGFTSPTDLYIFVAIDMYILELKRLLYFHIRRSNWQIAYRFCMRACTFWIKTNRHFKQKSRFFSI